MTGKITTISTSWSIFKKFSMKGSILSLDNFDYCLPNIGDEVVIKIKDIPLKFREEFKKQANKYFMSGHHATKKFQSEVVKAVFTPENEYEFYKKHFDFEYLYGKEMDMRAHFELCHKNFNIDIISRIDIGYYDTVIKITTVSCKYSSYSHLSTLSCGKMTKYFNQYCENMKIKKLLEINEPVEYIGKNHPSNLPVKFW